MTVQKSKVKQYLRIRLWTLVVDFLPFPRTWKPPENKGELNSSAKQQTTNLNSQNPKPHSSDRNQIKNRNEIESRIRTESKIRTYTDIYQLRIRVVQIRSQNIMNQQSQSHTEIRNQNFRSYQNRMVRKQKSEIRNRNRTDQTRITIAYITDTEIRIRSNQISDIKYLIHS